MSEIQGLWLTVLSVADAVLPLVSWARLICGYPAQTLSGAHGHSTTTSPRAGRPAPPRAPLITETKRVTMLMPGTAEETSLKRAPLQLAGRRANLKGHDDARHNETWRDQPAAGKHPLPPWW